jgi:hypothetical protein
LFYDDIALMALGDDDCFRRGATGRACSVQSYGWCGICDCAGIGIYRCPSHLISSLKLIKKERCFFGGLKIEMKGNNPFRERLLFDHGRDHPRSLVSRVEDLS